MSTPAGWYPDPTGRHQNRWFDGSDWADQVADGQAVSVDPVIPVASPAATTEATPAPGAPAPAGPPPGAPTAPGGAPLGSSTSPDTTSGGGNNLLLIIGALLVAAAVAVGLVLAFGGGGDGGGETAGSSDTEAEPQDQSDAPGQDADPSVSDLFDDMADSGTPGGDIFGTDDEPADQPADTTSGGDYPQEVIDNFTNACTDAGSPASFCGCVIDVLQRDVAYDRFVEIDQELGQDSTAVPPELTAAATECQ